MFHALHTHLPKPEKMNNPFFYEPNALCILAAEEVKTMVATHNEWREEVQAGKMFGVLVVERPSSHGMQLGLPWPLSRVNWAVRPRGRGLFHPCSTIFNPMVILKFMNARLAISIASCRNRK